MTSLMNFAIAFFSVIAAYAIARLFRRAAYNTRRIEALEARLFSTTQRQQPPDPRLPNSTDPEEVARNLESLRPSPLPHAEIPPTTKPKRRRFCALGPMTQPRPY